MVIVQLLFAAIRNLRSARTTLRERTPIVVRPWVVQASSDRWVSGPPMSYRWMTTPGLRYRG